MKETLLELARYNVWANKLIIEVVLKLDIEQLDKPIISSFDSIRKTIMHTYAAEYVWLQRLQLAEQPAWLGNEIDRPIFDVCMHWQEVSATLLKFVEKQFDDKALEHVLQYYNLQKVSTKMPVYQVLMHVFNHATYHRGQLVTMLRQAGVAKLPSTDFMIWTKQ